MNRPAGVGPIDGYEHETSGRDLKVTAHNVQRWSLGFSASMHTTEVPDVLYRVVAGPCAEVGVEPWGSQVVRVDTLRGPVVVTVNGGWDEFKDQSGWVDGDPAVFTEGFGPSMGDTFMCTVEPMSAGW